MSLLLIKFPRHKNQQRQECLAHKCTSSLRFQCHAIPATPYPQYLQGICCLCHLQRGRSKLCAKDNVPESAGDSETILIVHKVVLEVVLLQFSPVSRQRLMVEEVVRQVIADVTKNTTAEDSSCNRPVPVEDSVS